MPLVTDVVWSAWIYDDPWPREADRCITFLPPWAECDGNGPTAAQRVTEDLCRGEWWNERFGADDCTAEMLVQIHEPAAIAGFYRVELVRTVKATTAQPLKGDPRHG